MKRFVLLAVVVLFGVCSCKTPCENGEYDYISPDDTRMLDMRENDACWEKVRTPTLSRENYKFKCVCGQKDE